MKIKHYMGYGTVQAKKIFKSVNCIKITVWGNHEWGLERDDKYDVFNWLVKRFDKTHKDYMDISSIDMSSYCKKIDGFLTEFCDYTIYFRD